MSKEYNVISKTDKVDFRIRTSKSINKGDILVFKRRRFHVITMYGRFIHVERSYNKEVVIEPSEVER